MPLLPLSFFIKMNRIIIAVLVSALALGASAQSAQNRYVSRMTQDGTLFFISPKKLNRSEGVKKFEYDMTWLSWSDSATVNWTFRSESMDLPREFAIQTCDTVFVCTSYSPLYQDIIRSGYETRITSKFSLSQIERMIQCPTSPEFVFKQDGVTKTASFSEGTWRKERKMLSDILTLYKHTK